MVHAVRMADIQERADSHRVGEQDQLEDLLQSLSRQLPVLSNEIAHRYLVHAGPIRKLTTAPIEP